MKKLLLPLVALLLSVTAAIGQTITGPLSICAGSNGTLSGMPAGGTWSCTLPGTITSGGVINSSTAGTSVVTYATGSGSAVAIVTFNPAPIISGPGTFTLCTTGTLAGAPAGGTWSSSNTAVATVGATSGVVTPISIGPCMITYALSTGCYATQTASINPSTTTVAGTLRVCTGWSSTLTGSPVGGTWTSATPSVATVSTSGGVVTGLTTGTARITYTPTCGTFTTRIVTVSTTAPAGAITGSTGVCVGGNTSLSATPTGGAWASSNPSVANVSPVAGWVTGMAVGTATISYIYSACPSGTSTAAVSVGAVPSCGPVTLCAGSTTTMSCAGAGATWSSASSLVSVTPAGAVTGLMGGAAIITYTTAGGCTGTDTVSILTVPTAITGATSLCAGGTSTLSALPLGGMWGSSDPSVATVSSGVVTGVAAGTAIVTYGMPTGCFVSTVITVGTASGAITITSTPLSCGNGYTLTASGGGAYTWSPATSLSCSTCATIVVRPSSSTTYVVTGTTGTCPGTASVTVGGTNRIYGNVYFASGMPTTPTSLVWLIQYDPTDSSITALDSVATCMDGGVPYFQFDGKPAGNYLVKAKLLSSVSGTSGYVPTYGSITPTWYTATNIPHGTATNMQNINMIYGMVPSGPGFISGYVYAGAGKGTSEGAPVAGMLIYLRNNAGTVLTHTYTDASGAYTFSSLANGSYVISPEEYDYYTTPSSILALNASTPNVTGVNFKQNTNNGTITPLPIIVNGVKNVVANNDISVYPNPASGSVFVEWMNQESGSADVVITDVLGREVSRSKINITTASGEAQMNTHSLNAGVYSISIKTNNSIHTERLLIQK